MGVGLGLAGYRPDEMDHRQMLDAKRVSEDLEIEKAMFEDKLKTTDWEATNEAIEEQIARESYLQWCRDKMRKDKVNNFFVYCTQYPLYNKNEYVLANEYNEFNNYIIRLERSNQLW